MRAEIKVSGIVQGVGFRPFIYRIAVKNRLVGYVRNRGDAVVEIVVEGKKVDVNSFLKDFKEKNPPLARIYEVTTNYTEAKNEFEKFGILKSSEDVELSGSIIPPDISICSECLRELRAPKNKRYDYFFITCTNCGPRYTIIERLPYDRPNTTMQDFPMCHFCSKEFRATSNRRFHAQTVACNECGPKAYLTANDAQPIEHRDPIREAGRLLEEGYIVAIKGNGGFHVATATTSSEPIARLRKAKHRTHKPFAIMARDLETVLHCSLIFAISRKYWFKPADFTARLKVSRCIRGEHDATTILLSPCSFIPFIIISCPGSLHTYSYVSAIFTPLNLEAASLTFSTSTVSLMFPPQWQMYTPTFVSSWLILTSPLDSSF